MIVPYLLLLLVSTKHLVCPSDYDLGTSKVTVIVAVAGDVLLSTASAGWPLAIASHTLSGSSLKMSFLGSVTFRNLPIKPAASLKNL